MNGIILFLLCILLFGVVAVLCYWSASKVDLKGWYDIDDPDDIYY